MFHNNLGNMIKYASVERQFDEVCSKAFAIGFSREMAIALIDKRNDEIKNKKKDEENKGNKKKKKYNLIPNIIE